MERPVTDIAIVGMGCRFPGNVHGPAEYWRFLTGKGDGIVEVPVDRWDIDRFYDHDPEAPGRMYTRHGGFLASSPWDFDAEFFGIAPREATVMDPQQRLVLEVAWEAFDDAGVAGRIAGRDVGVYVGGFMTDNQVRRHLPSGRTAIDNHTATSGALTMLSNRLSHVLDLRGPSMTIDTACSSSLVAIHEATQALVRGECEVAVAGGVNVMLHPETFVSMCKGRFLAPDGRCKTFDAAADGYGRGEGAGMIVLKPAGAALRDGDRIYAVIRGSGSNQDGRTTGITVPNPDAQYALARRVCTEAGIDPGQISFVEAHGTGTAVGDPIEMSALGKAFGNVAGRPAPVVVGSVKAAIGHLEAAAGVAGVMKAALSVYHRRIVPQARLKKLNPAIPFTELNLRVPTEVESFPADYEQITVAVNGFGYGGTNAHLLLEEAPVARPPSSHRTPLRVLPLSGSNEAAVRAGAKALEKLVAEGNDPDLICDAAWTRRAHHQFRHAVSYVDGADLVRGLARLADGQGIVGRTIVPAGTRPVFVFSGMGPQWWRMGRDLLQAGGVFARKAAEIDAVFTGIAGWSIIGRLLSDERTSQVLSTETAQPANFLLQVSLAAELEAAGVQPSAFVGHSVGEVSAAYLSGALRLRDALLVSYHRARLQATTAGSGGMLAVGLSEAQARDELAALPSSCSDVCVAAVNSPSSVTLAGTAVSLEVLRARLDQAGIFVRPLQVTVPYHSALMDPILPDLEAMLGGIHPAEPSRTIYSTVTTLSDGRLMDAVYWRDNVREPVRFADTVCAMVQDGHRVFLEVGPHPVLSGNIRETLLAMRETGATISTLNRKEDDLTSLKRAVGELYTAGCLDGHRTPGTDGGLSPHADLPVYPWQRSRLWSEPPAVLEHRISSLDTRPLLGTRLDSGSAEWQTELSNTQLPWLRDHVVDGVVVLPGAAYLDALMAAAAERTCHRSLVVESVRFIAPFVIDEHDVPALRLTVDESTNRCTISSRRSGGTEWTVNCTGRLVDAPVDARLVELPTINGTTLTSQEFYARLAARGLAYGPTFRQVSTARVDGDTAVATIEAAPASTHLVHPGVLDGALQCIAALEGLPAGTLVPAKVGAVRLFAPLPRGPVTAITHRRPGPGVHADVRLCDSTGRVFLELADVEFAAITPPVPAAEELDKFFYELRWEPWEASETRETGDRIVVSLGTASRVIKEAGLIVVQPEGIAEALARKGSADTTVAVVAGGGDAVDLVAGLVTTANAIQQVVEISGRQDLRAVVVTEGAFRLPGDKHKPDSDHAALVGARRALRNEQPALHWRLVDLDPGGGWDLPGDADADEICVRQGICFAPRIRRTLTDRLEPFTGPVAVRDPEASFELEIPTSKLFTDLALRFCDRIEPGPGEVEVRMDAIGLNYKDSMKIIGLLTERELRGTYFGTSVGMEGLGVVARVGAGADLRPGDRVVVGARDMFRRYLTVRCDKGLVSLAPRDAGPAYAASLLPLLTAHYGLKYGAGLRAGETVLVHGAAGGTGLAAIQVALALGARVIGSAGSPERRDFARAAGAYDVVNSRSLNFVDDVRRLTDGRGADVVFTSLSGEAMRQNLNVAAEFGRIVEIGKLDIYGGGVMELAPFDRNLSFIAVDMDRMFECQPDTLRMVAAEVLDRLHNGEYQALPTTTYPVADISTACEAVARATHVGRVAVTFDDTSRARPARPAFEVREHATYLVTGGFGAFGMALADWLVRLGARHIVLVGRRGAVSPDVRRRLRAWEASSIEIHQMCADVADPQAVCELFDKIAATMPPLRGVFHAAGVLDDRPVSEVTMDTLRRVMDPKISGAWNLHRAAGHLDLDAFVLCSSVSALIGLAGQVAYAAANASLDAIAALRLAEGKRALSINWGALGGGGMAEEAERYLELVGVRPIMMDRATAFLQESMSLGAGVGNAAVIDIDWNAWARTNPASASSIRFAQHVTEAGKEGVGAESLRGELLAMPVDERAEVLAFILAEHAAQVLGIAAAAIDRNTPLPELGLDSLLSVELTARLTGTLGIELSALQFSRGAGLSAIARHVAAGLGEA
jgi:acyl transferase domain-containing protein/NADPH:quinone reductase-like Zn-dependent oxidoreductase